MTNFDEMSKKLKEIQKQKEYFEKFANACLDYTNLIFDFPRDSMERIVKMNIEEKEKTKNKGNDK